MRLPLAILAILFGITSTTYAGYTRGYYKRNGTYVAPHHKTNPDCYRYNNYSAKGNINPYTLKKGTQAHEFTNPAKYNKCYRSR